MEYKGKLYGKIGNDCYFPLDNTADDFDNLIAALQETDKDLCVLYGQMKGLSDLIGKWRERNKKALNNALS